MGADQPRRRVLTGGALAAFGLTGCSTTGPRAPAEGKARTTGSSQPSDWVAVENARPGATHWALQRTASDRELAAYASSHSIRPGDPLSLHVSSGSATAYLRVLRLGYYDAAGAREVAAQTLTGLQREAPPRQDRGTGKVWCQWPTRAQLDTSAWPEGSYLLRVAVGDDPQAAARYVPLTVRSQAFSGRLALMSATTTYAAYNEWGGASLYYGREPNGARSFSGRARVVSLARPEDGNGAKIVTKYELGAVTWIERVAAHQGIDLAYLSDLDLEADRRHLVGARGVFSLGHDEYWSVPKRQALTAALNAGCNVAFLGANSCYWRVRVDTQQRTVTCYKSASEDPVSGPTTTAMWRSEPDPDPECSLTGMLYEAFPASGPMVIHDPTFFAFRGLPTTPVPGLIGAEIDRAYPIAQTPSNLQVVAHSPVALAGGRSTFADMTYWTAPGGAGVVSVGTMGWTVALRDSIKKDLGHTAATQRFTREVTGRLAEQFAAGPLGPRYPARSNLAKLHARADTATGTGGPVGRATPARSASRSVGRGTLRMQP